MDLVEYQGKQYFARYGLPISPGEVADTVGEAQAAAERLGYPVVVKAQVQVGGRGKAGGIKLASSATQVTEHATAILGMDIKGHTVRRLWIEKATDIAKECTRASRSTGLRSSISRWSRPVVGSTSSKSWKRILARSRLHVNPLDGVTLEALRELVERAGLDPEAREGAAEILLKLYTCYIEGDADLVEINPLVLTTDGEVRVLDAKVTLDDDAAFRHPEWAEIANLGESSEHERLAKSKGLSYIPLDGSVGIIANGAGLAMSTVDMVSQVGGAAANFLDVGGGADEDGMAITLEVINLDPSVRAIFVNIFGGIVRCDEVARGIVSALDKVDIASQIVLRLDGTNAAEARRIIEERASEKIISELTMLSAARARSSSRVRPSRKEVRSCEHLRGRDDPRGRPRTHREPGPLSRPAQPRLRHEGGRGRDPWQGRPGRGRHPCLRHRCRGGRRHRGRPRASSLCRPARHRGRSSTRLQPESPSLFASPSTSPPRTRRS